MMADGLALFWIVIGGLLMYGNRARASHLLGRLPLARPLKFIVFATVMALLEEAVTTTMTNLARVWRARRPGLHHGFRELP